MKNLLLALFALAAGFALGLAYAWLISPVEYVDASPAMLRDDFKDQYRVAIAASYAAAHDLARARARLELLGAANPLGDLNAQTQRMVGSGESAENMRLLAQLATDLQKGAVSLPPTHAPWTATSAPTPSVTESAAQTSTPDLIRPTFTPTQEAVLPTPFAALAFTLTPRPTLTAPPSVGKPFILVGQDAVCDPGIQTGLLQFKLVDSRRRQMAGVEITVISIEGEEHFFTGFKPEVGNGYADFVMRENISYSVRVGDGGMLVYNLSAPACVDPNGIAYFGGISLSFQQP